MYLNIEVLNYYFGFFISLFCYKMDKENKKCIMLFWKKSMEIYCIHLLILAGIRIILLKFFKNSELWSVVLFSGFITLILCYMFFYKITYEKFKIIFGEK